MSDRFDRLWREAEQLPQVAHTSMMELLDLSPEIVRFFRALLRNRGKSASDVAQKLELTDDQAAKLARVLAEKGYLQIVDRNGEQRYLLQLAHTRAVVDRSGIWDTLVDTSE